MLRRRSNLLSGRRSQRRRRDWILREKTVLDCGFERVFMAADIRKRRPLAVHARTYDEQIHPVNRSKGKYGYFPPYLNKT